MTDRENAVASAFNRLFEIQMEWRRQDIKPQDVYVSEEDMEEFVALCAYINSIMSNKTVCTAIETLSRNIIVVGAALHDDKLLSDVKLDDDEKEYIHQLLYFDNGVFYSMTDRIDEKSRSNIGALKFGLHDVELKRLSADEGKAVISRFYRHEQDLLKKSGLNQYAIAVIIDRIKELEGAIVNNIERQRIINSSRVKKLLDSFMTDVATLERVFRGKWTLIARGASLKIPQLLKSKDKVIGLATLWGDAVPLIVQKDWGIASVISATAGATVAAVFPQKADK